jgi:hypothetical protein
LEETTFNQGATSGESIAFEGADCGGACDMSFEGVQGVEGGVSESSETVWVAGEFDRWFV